MARARGLLTTWTAEERTSLAGRLRSARRAVGYTQEGVAAAIGVKPKSLWRWESAQGAPLPAFRAKLAVLYGVEETVLFSQDARCLSQPLVMTVSAGRASARVEVGPDNDLRAVISELAEWCKRTEQRLDQLQFRVECLADELHEHEEEKGSPNGFAHAVTVVTRDNVHEVIEGYEVEGYEVELVLTDAESRLALLEQRLGAVTATVRTMLAALGTMSEVLAEDG